MTSERVIFRAMRHEAQVILRFSLIAALQCCHGAQPTDPIDRIEPGMSLAEVTRILGPPSREERRPFLDLGQNCDRSAQRAMLFASSDPKQQLIACFDGRDQVSRVLHLQVLR